MYTFLPIAPCSFVISGVYYDIKVNEPFQVELEVAKKISSPSFRFRKYVRLITPLPPEINESQEPKVQFEVSPQNEPVRQDEKISGQSGPINEKISEQSRPLDEKIDESKKTKDEVVVEPKVEPVVKTEDNSVYKPKKKYSGKADLK